MKIEYVTLYVNNLEFTKEFFIKYFGANIEKTLNIAFDAKAYVLSFDEGCMLEIITHPHRKDTEKFFRRTGFNRLVINVGSPKKLWDITDQLQADGYDLISSPHDTYNGYYGCCVIDSRLYNFYKCQHLVLVYKCGQEKLNDLYYEMKEQRRCSTWRKIKNRILRNLSSRSSICIMPEEPRIHNWNVNMA